MRAVPVLLLPFALILGLSACSTPKDHYLIRNLDLSSQAVALPQDSTTLYALREVELPEYLDNLKIVYFGQGNRLVISENSLWAQSLGDNIRQVLLQSLSKGIGSPRFYSYPLANNLRPQRILDIQIIEMVANAETDRFTLTASWQVANPGERNPQSYDFSQSYLLQGTDPQTIVANYQQALADLAIAILPTLPAE